MSELGDKVKTTIERIKAFEPKNGEGYYLAFSGGKDSVVCKALLDMAGVKYDAHYRVTSVDPPELVNFIKTFPNVKRDVPRYPDSYKNPKLAGKPITMWNLIPEKLMPPTRLVRYCCQALKETGGDGRLAVTGVRWAESANRAKEQGLITINSKKAVKDLDATDYRISKKGRPILINDNEKTRRVIESCYKRHKTLLNPIIEWTDDNVWEFIRAENVPYCGLYDCGMKRLGCIGCPMAGMHSREVEFLRWPKYKQAYLRSFEKMLQNRIDKGLIDNAWRMGTSANDVFNWWMEYDILPGQMDLFETDDEEET